MSGIVFVHRKGMDFKVRHGLCIEKGHDLLVQGMVFVHRKGMVY